MLGQSKLLSNGIKYYFHGELVCKETLVYKKHKLHPNYSYKNFNINKNRFELEDVLDGFRIDVPIHSIIKNFSLPYCNTVHSIQGASVNNKFVIVDWKESYVDPKWFYTAISRAMDFDGIKEMNKVTVAKAMIQGYKEQDNYAKRVFDDEYYQKCHGKCRKCNSHMSFEKHSPHKVTVNRLNNSIAHHKSNGELLCLKCNKIIK